MYHLDCEQVILHPLTINHLHWFVNDIKKLEKALNLESASLEFSGPDNFRDQLFEKINNITIPAVMENRDQYMWYTHWLVINKEKKNIIGGIGLQGEPDRNNEVFLNFYEDKNYEGMGFLIEALHCLARWLLKTGKVSNVKVITENDQLTTQGILEKSGFRIFRKRIEDTEWVYPG